MSEGQAHLWALGPASLSSPAISRLNSPRSRRKSPPDRSARARNPSNPRFRRSIARHAASRSKIVGSSAASTAAAMDDGFSCGDDDEECYCSDRDSLDGLANEDSEYDWVPPKGPSTKVITKESLLSAQDLGRVMDLLSLREHHARTLLIHHRWDVEKLLAVLVEKGKACLFVDAGVPLTEDQDLSLPKQSTSTIMCDICMEEIPGHITTRMDCSHRYCNDCWTEHFVVKINEGQSKRIRHFVGCVVVLRGRDHTWSNIAGHSCGRYKEDQEQKSERAKRDLYRYMHYHNRYKGHLDSFKLENKLRETIQEKVSVSEEKESALRDFTWVTNGLYRLFRSRRVLLFSYPFAFYMFGEELFKDEMTQEQRDIKQHLFEDQQQQLEANVERLSKFLEEPFDEYDEKKVMDVRMHVINLSVVTDTLCRKMYECIENDLLGCLVLGTHNIAPYKSKGIERAAALNAKADESDKCLPLDFGKAGASEPDRPSGSGSLDDGGRSSRKRARKEGLVGALIDLNVPAGGY
ncbi:hypothetical protein NL676_015557 [Syzygium grande]|nr:hypothetical protein NL676_015557 [Syzygium grande]